MPYIFINYLLVVSNNLNNFFLIFFFTLPCIFYQYLKKKKKFNTSQNNLNINLALILILTIGNLIIINFNSLFSFHDVDSGSYIYWSIFPPESLEYVDNKNILYLAVSFIYRYLLFFWLDSGLISQYIESSDSLKIFDFSQKNKWGQPTLIKSKYYYFQKNIFALNYLFVIFANYILCFKIYLNKKDKIITNLILFIFLSLSFASFKYSSYAGKEAILYLTSVFTLFNLVKIKVNLFNNKHYIFNLFILLILITIGTLIRPYYVSYFIFLLLVAYNNEKIEFSLISIIYLGFSLFYCIYYTLIDIENIVIFLYNYFGLIFSPNIFRFTNYFNYTYEIITHLVFIFILFFVFLSNTKFFIKFVISILIIAIPMAIVVIFYNQSYANNPVNAFYITRLRFPIYYILFFFLIFRNINHNAK